MAVRHNKLPPGIPATLPGFETITRYWDNQNDTYAAKLFPGEFYVSTSGELITTVLGSCISSCIRDTRTGIGGMNHFMLPVHNGNSSWKDTPVDMQTRYGNIAMERLINTILSNGGNREDLEIKLFGGGKVLQIDTDIGGRNIEFVKQYLETEGLGIDAEDVGGTRPRKVLYFPGSGRVRMKLLGNIHNNTLQQREESYIDSLSQTPVEGEIDLFQ